MANGRTPTETDTELPVNNVYQGDCIALLDQVAAQSVDLVFADPPFNIGYEYDSYDDQRSSNDYLQWCEKWISAVADVLKPNGTFWLAIGDEYAAELKLLAQRQAGFTCRSWVIWYYTFGVNVARGFSRSHTHLFHFVKDPNQFTFNSDNPAVRVLSARQLVYADNRANSAGRLPDNTWILRPQDAPSGGFAPSHDTWYYARVAGTFKEREGFHGCQMPEQLLGRIIRVSSNPLDVVLDPFAGSGTTLAAAKKLGRNYLGFELSHDYVEHLNHRLQSCQAGDPLDGPEDPVRSAPKTSQGKSKLKLRNGRPVPKLDDDTAAGLVEAYTSACDGQSTDAVLCDPELNRNFVAACKKAGLTGNADTWNRLLLRLRKTGKLPNAARNRRWSLEELDPIQAASEIAMQLISCDFRLTMDEILCAPKIAKEFDRLARQFAPGATPFEYRWCALTIRRRANRSKLRAARNCYEWLHCELPKSVSLTTGLELNGYERGGLYTIASDQTELYVGESGNVRQRLQHVLELESWQDLAPLTVRFHPLDNRPSRQALQCVLIQRLRPLLNSRLLQGNCTSDTAQLHLFD